MDLPDTLTWLTQKNKFLLKTFLVIPPKTNFSKKNFFYTRLKGPIFYLKKTFLILVWKKKFQTKIISYNYRKSQFSKLKTLYTCPENWFLTLSRKVKTLHFWCVFNLFLKLNRVLNKVIRMNKSARVSWNLYRNLYWFILLEDQLH